MNAKKADKTVVTITKHSKLLLAVLALGKLKGYIHHYEIVNNVLNVEIGKLNSCNAIKPRFFVTLGEIDSFRQNAKAIQLSCAYLLLNERFGADKRMRLMSYV